MASFTNMSESEQVKEINLLMPLDGPEVVTVDDEMRIRFTLSSFLLDVHTTMQAITYRATLGVEVFDLRTGNPALGEDAGRYYIVHWTDAKEPSVLGGSTAVEGTTWSTLKKSF